MNKYSRLGVIVVLFVLVGVWILAPMPQQQRTALLEGAWQILISVPLILGMGVGPAALGRWGKKFLPNTLGHESVKWERNLLLVVSGASVFLIWIVMIPALMQPWNWFLWELAQPFEGLAYDWGIWALVLYWLGWAFTNHEEKK